MTTSPTSMLRMREEVGLDQDEPPRRTRCFYGIKTVAPTVFLAERASWALAASFNAKR